MLHGRRFQESMRYLIMSDEPPDAKPAAQPSAGSVPFPDSLCHRCAAPPRYIKTERSTFIYCPILKRYPPQPVRDCEAFVPREEDGA
jgi:hypothetical protein